MFNRHRSKIGAAGLAFAIVLASVAAFLLIDSATIKQSEYENSAKYRADNYSERRDVIIRDRCQSLARDKKAACINEERETARQGYRDEYDLEAQRVTANWTEHMGIAAIIGMAASLIGVGLVFFTFRETQRTAQIAQYNLDAYRDSEAGRLVPQLTQAWETLKVSGKNVGKSYVQVMHVDIASFPFQKGGKVVLKTKLRDSALRRNVAIGVGDEYHLPDIELPENGATTVAGGLIYKDMFGRLHLCHIAVDVVMPSFDTHASVNVDFSKWEKFMRDLEAGKEVEPE